MERESVKFLVQNSRTGLSKLLTTCGDEDFEKNFFFEKITKNFQYLSSIGFPTNNFGSVSKTEFFVFNRTFRGNKFFWKLSTMFLFSELEQKICDVLDENF